MVLARALALAGLQVLCPRWQGQGLKSLHLPRPVLHFQQAGVAWASALRCWAVGQ